MLANLKRIIEYCQTINTGIPVPQPYIVAVESQGTTVLNNPVLAGPQIVISLPLANLSGNSDGMRGSIAFIIYAVEKARELTATRAEVVTQYLSTMEMLDVILEKFSADIGGQGAPGACPLLSGMDLVEIETLSAAGVFGSWNGYSATITLK